MSEAAENTIVRERFDVDNDMKAEWCLSKIRKARREQAEQKAELARQMKFYQDQMDLIDHQTDQEVAFFEDMLKGYFRSRVDDGFAKASKTKITYKLPTGEMMLKHREPEFEYKKEQDKTIAFCKASGLQSMVKVKEELNWAELKKKVTVSGNGVVLTETGEIVPGITATERDDEFVVEVK